MTVCSWRGTLAVPLSVLAIGCSRGPGALHPPQVDAAAAADAAIAEFDRNSDGALSKDEWSASGALMAVAERYDQNSDGRLQVGEIRSGIEGWQENAIGPRPVPFTVHWNNRPLAGATVRLVPASFMQDVLPQATAETGGGGGGHLAMAEEDRPKNAPNMPLVQPGLYNVEITHPSIEIPAKYNAQTTLGIEITSSNPGPQGVLWSLSSK